MEQELQAGLALGRQAEHAARVRAEERFQKLVDSIEAAYRECGRRYAAGDKGIELGFVGAVASIMDIHAGVQLPAWWKLRRDALIDEQVEAEVQRRAQARE